jgi:hypothetical protein
MMTKGGEVVEEIQVQHETGMLYETKKPVFQYTHTETMFTSADCGHYMDVLEHFQTWL